MAIETVAGNGKNILFCIDRWLLVQSLKQALQHLFNAVAARASKRTVFDIVTGGRWILVIRCALNVPVLIEYLNLW